MPQGGQDQQGETPGVVVRPPLWGDPPRGGVVLLFHELNKNQYFFFFCFLFYEFIHFLDMYNCDVIKGELAFYEVIY